LAEKVLKTELFLNNMASLEICIITQSVFGLGSITTSQKYVQVVMWICPPVIKTFNADTHCGNFSETPLKMSIAINVTAYEAQ
jgi:hypothetical protein